MISISAYGAPPAVHRAAATLSIQVLGAVRAIRSWHEARVAIRHLRSLSDCLLKDVGLHRSQIEFAVHCGRVTRPGRYSVPQ